ncbi:pyridoxal 5'-phosphate synthase glutaminase subunit PdxT [Murdochiella massiliensis]|uniref:pyridoxal 5'-phosphate synthase glutaminase subunit PdxT n=1 Tax=Murdochiella massiliensis TaxID=1673723 RepID=UPI00082AA498|nr:pyridoxal 5'-phosphate synthase glutaminase subunit PdxT [Murdochiella massiliensis]
MPIGVLALQGAFIEHEKMLRRLGADVREVRQRSDLDGLNGIVLPGGESTVQGRLLRKLHMLEPLRDRIQNGMPVLATCAGLILLAQHLDGDETTHLATLPVTVRRNAYGRQLASFATTANVGNLTDFPLVFIRAPYIAAVDGNGGVAADEVSGSGGGTPEVVVSGSRGDAPVDVVNGGRGGPPVVEVLCTISDRIVAVRYGAQIGLAFHPELTEDARLHEAFLETVKQGNSNL